MQVLLILAALAAVENATGGDDLDSCVSCHQILSDERLSQPTRGAHYGVHSKALSCSDCHGGDRTKFEIKAAKGLNTGYAGAPGGPSGAAAMCGKCHEKAFHTWSMSAHNPSALCSTCHSSHEVKMATLDLISPSRCSGCHPFPKANTLKHYIVEARTAVLSVRARADKLAGEGMDVGRTPAGLSLLDAKIAGIYHMADGEMIKTSASKIRADAAGMGAVLSEAARDRQVKRKVTWGIIIFLISAIIAGAYYFIHALKMKRMLER